MSTGTRQYLVVAPAGAHVGSKQLFTYHFETNLPKGTLVHVPLGKQTRLGVVTETVGQPDFTTKPIAKVLGDSLPENLMSLAVWISQYYAAPLTKVLQTILPPNLNVSARAKKVAVASPAAATQKKAVVLTPEQEAAVKNISSSTRRTFLLHGVTGSGKTQVYIELVREALKNNRSSIVLVPEIALTTQIVAHFKNFFGDRVLVTHSGMTTAARRNIWQKAATDKPFVVIGPRSALFLPLKNIGYIIVDESHESSYKQEQTPRYHAIPVAAKLCELHQAKLVLGSATPSVADLFLAKAGKLTILTLLRRIHQEARVAPRIVDLRDRQLLTRSQFLSEPLLKLLKETLARGRQSILLMNRRGSARLALCKQCNWVASCPHCQIPLTFHADRGILLCHWCDFKQSPPAQCPDCGHMEIVFLGGGTKRIEAEIKHLLPEATTLRLDRDSLKANELQEVFKQLHDGTIDILIGTQMVAKGLDLPNVDTVGVILADTMLYLPDYTAGERTFQLLHQVSGRAGRRVGSVAQTIIQTFSPDHPAVQAAANEDFETFAARELNERQTLNYPPFVYLLKLTCKRATRAGAQAAGGSLVRSLKKVGGIEVVGPAPAWRETLRGHYYWQVIIKSKHRPKLVEIAANVPANWIVDLDPVDLL